LRNKIVGSVRGYKENGTCFIGRLIVDSKFQNKGFGKLLMNNIEKEFSGCTRLELFTGDKSNKNLYLYNKLGYKEFKRQRINEKLVLIYLEKINH